MHQVLRHTFNYNKIAIYMNTLNQFIFPPYSFHAIC